MLVAQAAPPPRFEFASLAPWIDEPGTVTIACILLAVLVGAVAVLYWRERSSLSPWRMLPLLLLRLTAILGVVVYALAPEKRDAREETRPSRVMVLVDDSLSMTLPNRVASASQPSSPRSQAVIDLLESQGLLAELSNSHEVHVATTSAPRSVRVVPLKTEAKPVEPDNPETPPPDWQALLAPAAVETRLGDALQQTAAVAAGGPLAGVVLVTDGQNNAGASPELAATTLGEFDAPVHAIGLGSESPAKNLAVRDLSAPRRAYPKDELRIAAVIESQAVEGAAARVSLFARPAGNDDATPVLQETQTVGPLVDGQLSNVEFLIRPEAEGQYEYRVYVDPIADELDEADNSATVEVQVIDRLLKVLLLAGGPTRDYHFLRDQLRRDDAFTVDVLLQSAPPGISQDADQVLTKLPTEKELEEYDLIVAFDADWTLVSRESVLAIEHCVSQRGAGFVFTYGPVNTPRWLRESDASRLAALLPVKILPQPLLLSSSERSSPRPEPIKLTREGRESPALWVMGDQQASVAFWEQELPGFYSASQVDSIKPAAMVFATAGDDNAGKPRVVFAEQFFGAGRCYYIGAPEVWRLRTEEPAAMRAFYTKLLQHLSQGRLLAESSAGSLLFERDLYSVGETLALRASLNREDQAPPEALAAQLELPSGRVETLPLKRGESGNVWTAGARAQLEGAYRATLVIPGAAQSLTAKTRVVVPALERSRSMRNVETLQQIAQQGGGNYYPTLDAVMSGGDGLPPLAQAIPSRTETQIVYGAPDDAFAQLVARWLLGVIAGSLLAEWATRRWMNLA